MKKRIAIYLAGSIKKGHENSQESFWTDTDILFLKRALEPQEVVFLNPAFRTDDLSDQRSIFGRDMLQVSSSDIVFVDARDRRGLGVGAEMMWAKMHQIPVITWAPRDSHYHKTSTTILGVPVDNFIHPFVEGLSDQVIGSLEEGVKWVQKLITGASRIKGPKDIQSAIQYYKSSQLGRDTPMQQILAVEDELSRRIKQSSPLDESDKFSPSYCEEGKRNTW
jgi:hypothetical protein